GLRQQSEGREALEKGFHPPAAGGCPVLGHRGLHADAGTGSRSALTTRSVLWALVVCEDRRRGLARTEGSTRPEMVIFFDEIGTGVDTCAYHPSLRPSTNPARQRALLPRGARVSGADSRAERLFLRQPVRARVARIPLVCGGGIPSLPE